jgi:hypothetical protein
VTEIADHAFEPPREQRGGTLADRGEEGERVQEDVPELRGAVGSGHQRGLPRGHDHERPR